MRATKRGFGTSPTPFRAAAIPSSQRCEATNGAWGGPPAGGGGDGDGNDAMDEERRILLTKSAYPPKCRRSSAPRGFPLVAMGRV